MTFRIGQKVVCVDASKNPYIIEGNVYTVRDIVRGGFIASGSPHEANRNDDEVFLVGISRHIGFYASRFRPIVERETDLSFAHEILRKASKPAKMPALVPSAHHRQLSQGKIK